MSLPFSVRGVICPTITPIDESENLDVETLIAHLDRVIAHVDGVMILGTTGELALLDDDVARKTIDVAIEHVADRVPVMVGVGDTGTTRTLKHVKYAAEAGANSISVCGPYYYSSLDQEALLGHYLRIADASAVPVVIYNIPQNTVNGLSAEAVAQLSEHENIVAIKDSTGDLIHFTRLLDLKREDFRVLQGANERLASITWQLGADGYVSGLENVAPGSMRRIQRAVETSVPEAIHGEQRRINELSRITDNNYWLSALKYAASKGSGGTGAACTPLPSLTVEEKLSIDRLLDQSSGEIGR